MNKSERGHINKNHLPKTLESHKKEVIGVSTYHQELPTLVLPTFCLLEYWCLHGEEREQVYYGEFEDYYNDEQ